MPEPDQPDSLLEAIDRQMVKVERCESNASEAGFHLRVCKRELKQERDQLRALFAEYRTGIPQYPMLDKPRPRGRRHGEDTPDEHQRGPTDFTIDLTPNGTRIAPRAAQGLPAANGRGHFPNPHDPPEEEAVDLAAAVRPKARETPLNGGDEPLNGGPSDKPGRGRPRKGK
jgi:hypothetical protein